MISHVSANKLRYFLLSTSINGLFALFSQELQLHLGVLQQHAALIGGPNATSCLICHKLFLGAEALMEHMKHHHKQEPAQPTAVPSESRFFKPISVELPTACKKATEAAFDRRINFFFLFQHHQPKPCHRTINSISPKDVLPTTPARFAAKATSTRDPCGNTWHAIRKRVNWQTAFECGPVQFAKRSLRMKLVSCIEMQKSRPQGLKC